MSLSMGVQDKDKGRKEEPSVNELVKLGISVTGRPSDKVDHLPIKKRRPLLRSPSPSPSPPPRTPLDGICAPDQWHGSDSVSNPEMLALNGLVEEQTGQGIENASVNTKLPYTEDSYGIELLASAACKNSCIDDVHNAKVGAEDKLLSPCRVDTSMDIMSLEKTSACPEREKLFLKDSRNGAQDASLDRIDSLAVPQNFHDKSESEAGKCSVSVKDVRFHWDLNTVMDEWELPNEDMKTSPPRNGLKDIPGKVLHCGESEKLQGCVEHRASEYAWELLKCTSDIEGSAQLISKSKYLDSSHDPVSDPGTTISPSEGMMNASTTKLTMQAREDFCTSAMQLGQTLSMENVQLGRQDDCCTSAVQPGKPLSMENVQLGNQDAVLLDPAVSEKGLREVVSIKYKEECPNLFDLPSNGNYIANLITKPSDAKELSSKSEKAGSSHFSSDHINLSMSATTLEESLSVPADVDKKKDISAPMIATPVDSSSDVEVKELMLKSYERFGEVALEDLLDDGDVSDISLGAHDHVVRFGKKAKYQAGCESPFEDGELRESVALSWEENEGETECLDYDIDDRDADDFATANHCMSEAGSESIQNDTNVNLAEKGTCRSANSLNGTSNSASVENISGQDQLPDGCEPFARTVEANNIKTEEIVASDSSHRLDVKGSFEEEAGSRETKGKLLSRVKGSSSSDAFNKKDSLHMQQGRSGSCYEAGQVFRSDKYLGRDRCVPRMQDESHKNNWVSAPSSYWNSRNHYQNGYRRGGGHPRPRSIIPDSEANIDGSAYRDQGRSTNYSMKGVYRPLVRRRPQDNNDNACSLHRGSIEARDESHGRTRGRSGIYRRGGFKDPRGEYHGPIRDEPASSSGWMPLSARRQRSSSPVLNRNASFSRPCRKSRSRSRTRSPIPWHLQEERNMGARRLGRSPDFRSEVRMERTRMPYEDSKFAENEDVLLSPPRKRFSAQGHSGWLNDRECLPSRFRERNSPQRFYGQHQRFDSKGPLGRMKSDDCFRPRINPGRFTKPSGEVWRGNNYNSNDNERTKYSNKYEIIRRVRHSETGGAVRRFHNDAEDCFEVHNTRNENGWEGRGPFKYDSERM